MNVDRGRCDEAITVRGEHAVVDNWLDAEIVRSDEQDGGSPA
jgi:hypothetical protein